MRDYNQFVRDRAASGHAAIRGHSPRFRAVGCTQAVDALTNASLSGTGVPIYYLNGNKVADDYADFLDGNWDESTSGRNQSGTSVSGASKDVWSGCEDDGTVDGPRYLGHSSSVRASEPFAGSGGLEGSAAFSPTVRLSLYGLSPVYQTQGVDYDSDDDGLIEVVNLAQLNAIRWDLDGDGTPISGSRDGMVATGWQYVLKDGKQEQVLTWESDPDAGGGPRGKAGYRAAFPNAAFGMGCPSTGCKGYELTANLDFDTNSNDQADSGDTYWNNGQGWLPIMEGKHYAAFGSITLGDGASDRVFSAMFEGNRHTIAKPVH